MTPYVKIRLAGLEIPYCRKAFRFLSLNAITISVFFYFVKTE
ncbi:hypothetical protein HMPREF0239_01848 [Clostridium sp. ATCC BAA-442]|uniref:Uncharacterized protein n=1 Tax=Flavonifractor plautii ATCC 29863 TaxID=411475 RepID=G9YPF4_FLAPL|nr:hypothetical protein HMPREF0372_01392 [Flavonifractor plautii ATCC 29863]ERI77118.1 hypothetical protein HMPREF0239_01848 [Clostridium sp. ATCC BAA-442]